MGAVLVPRLDTSQPNLSNHLACLRGCGLVTATRDGRRVRHQLASERLAHAIEDLVAAAFNAALRVAEETSAQKMAKITAGLPPGMKLPF